MGAPFEPRRKSHAAETGMDRASDLDLSNPCGRIRFHRLHKYPKTGTGSESSRCLSRFRLRRDSQTYRFFAN